ncbi:MAG: hypothetical protein LBF13_01610 [Campylobacteraceae bacterium]|nr:hypothetical protein [Campylobacteraceae bacterium]
MKLNNAISDAAKEIESSTFAIYEQSCDDKNLGISCYFLAQAYEAGEGIAKDIKKAKYYYKKACELGHKEAYGK